MSVSQFNRLLRFKNIRIENKIVAALCGAYGVSLAYHYYHKDTQSLIKKVIAGSSAMLLCEALLIPFDTLNINYKADRITLSMKDYASRMF